MDHQQVYKTPKTKVHIQVTNHICLPLLIQYKTEILFHIAVTLYDGIIPTCNSTLYVDKNLFKHTTLKLLLLLHYFLSKTVHFKLMRSVNPTTQCNISEEWNPQHQHCGNLKSYILSFI
jgi:hypothetical protein